MGVRECGIEFFGALLSSFTLVLSLAFFLYFFLSASSSWFVWKDWSVVLSPVPLLLFYRERS
jgi:hypothetical protein